jgi:hypothetical protein
MVLQTNYYTPVNKHTGKREIVTQTTKLDKSFNQPIRVNGRVITVKEKAESLAKHIAQGQYFSHKLITD